MKKNILKIGAIGAIAAVPVLTFAAGEIVKSFTVSAFDNSNITGNKTFIVTISSPTGGAALGYNKQATVSIVDDESMTFGTGSLKMSKSTYEATHAQGSLVVTVLRSGGASGTVSVDYSTAGGSGSSGNDFGPVSGTLTFEPGESSKTISIPIINNPDVNTERTFFFNLNNAVGTHLIDPNSSEIIIYR